MRARSLLLLAGCAVALALSASAQQQRPRAAAARAAAARQAQAQAQAPAVAPPPANPAQSRPLQVDMQAAIRQSKTPTSAIGGLVNAAFVISNRPAIDRLKIPVLLPVDPDIALGMKLFPNGEFYTVSSTSRGMSFVLNGSGRAFPLPPAIARAMPKASLASRIPADGIVVEQTEGGVDASFVRFGAAYSISLECAKPRLDDRCKDDAYLRGVISRLMTVIPGGGG